MEGCGNVLWWCIRTLRYTWLRYFSLTIINLDTLSRQVIRLCFVDPPRPQWLSDRKKHSSAAGVNLSCFGRIRTTTLRFLVTFFFVNRRQNCFRNTDTRTQLQSCRGKWVMIRQMKSPFNAQISCRDLYPRENGTDFTFRVWSMIAPIYVWHTQSFIAAKSYFSSFFPHYYIPLTVLRDFF